MPVHIHISFTLAHYFSLQTFCVPTNAGYSLTVCCLNEKHADGDRELLYFISSLCVIWRFQGLDTAFLFCTHNIIPPGNVVCKIECAVFHLCMCLPDPVCVTFRLKDIALTL